MTDMRGRDVQGTTDGSTVSLADIRLAAMNLLARREHSLKELRHKLSRRFSDELLIDHELARLAQENLQSDARFAESFARQRAERGYGPLRIRQQMRERGLSDSAIAAAFDAAEIDWYCLAAEVYRKKYGAVAAYDIKEKARRVRFLQYRGFSAEHYQGLLD